MLWFIANEESKNRDDRRMEDLSQPQIPQPPPEAVEELLSEVFMLGYACPESIEGYPEIETRGVEFVPLQKRASGVEEQIVLCLPAVQRIHITTTDPSAHLSPARVLSFHRKQIPECS